MADGKPVVVNEQQVEKFLFPTLKLNSTILKHSRMAAVVLVSLPPPPVSHPAYFFMEYLDLLVENVPRLLIVRGYRRDVCHFIYIVIRNIQSHLDYSLIFELLFIGFSIHHYFM
ncbi:secondary carrier transporter [Lithospermum erythrorhizon]|uniref:Secondary carrier transporter n=1 Tax=Lithospermum erythrorhizon TaxID=34254 RepID=A0AAV3RNY3_LITER